MKFKYFFELKEGYIPVLQDEQETDISIVIESKNRATADRMIKALIKPGNIIEYSGIAIDSDY